MLIRRFAARQHTFPNRKARRTTTPRPALRHPPPCRHTMRPCEFKHTGRRRRGVVDGLAQPNRFCAHRRGGTDSRRSRTTVGTFYVLSGTQSVSHSDSTKLQPESSLIRLSPVQMRSPRSHHVDVCSTLPAALAPTPASFEDGGIFTRAIGSVPTFDRVSRGEGLHRSVAALEKEFQGEGRLGGAVECDQQRSSSVVVLPSLTRRLLRGHCLAADMLDASQSHPRRRYWKNTSIRSAAYSTLSVETRRLFWTKPKTGEKLSQRGEFGFDQTLGAMSYRSLFRLPNESFATH